jgi:hypothetical protein
MTIGFTSSLGSPASLLCKIYRLRDPALTREMKNHMDERNEIS